MTYDEFLVFLNDFEKIKSFAGKMKAANENLTRIGSGTGRVVYDIDGTKVFKIAKNAKGVAQNEAEINIGYYSYNQNIVTKIFESADDYTWIIAEAGKRVNEKRIKQITGISSLNNLYMYLRNFDSMNHGKGRIFGLDQDVQEELDNNEFSQDLQNFIADNSQSAGDMGRPSSYGEVIRDGQPAIVLTDYGLNDEVYDTYYNPQRKNKYSYQLYELYGFNDGNDDILSDIGNTDDIRRGMWGLIPYGVGDGDNVVNEGFISFVMNRDKYPKRMLPSTPFIVDMFHECVNNLKDVLNHVPNKKKFYKNLLALQEYLVEQNWYDRDLLSEEEYQIDETTKPNSRSGLSRANDLNSEYALKLTNATVKKLNLSPNMPKLLGSGGFGYAYELDSENVFKITTDVSEADSATKVMRGHPKYIADVFGLYKIIDSENSDASFYGILQENITNKPTQEFYRLEKIITEIKPNGLNFGDLAFYFVKKKYTSEQIVEIAKKILTDNPEANVSEDDRKLAYKYIMDLLNIRNDLINLEIKSHDYIVEPRNLGYKDGVLKYFDVGGYVADEPYFNDSNTIYLPESINLNELYDQPTANKIAQQVVAKLGYGQPRYIGSGNFGVAYDIGDDKILKITKDKTEAVENLKLMNKQLKYIAQPYEVYKVNSTSGDETIPETYVIILEKLDTDPSIIRNFERLDYVFKSFFKITIPDAIEFYLGWWRDPVVSKEKIDRYLKKNPQDAEFFYGLIRIAEELQQYGVESIDFVNKENLGYKKSGALGFFDVGFGNALQNPVGAKEIAIAEDGSSKFSTDNSIGQDDFPVYNQNDTSPLTDNNVPPINEDLEYNHVVGDATEDEYMMTERKLSYMPDAKAVTVKKKCRLGGLGNTSAACNQGDISNLELKNINEGGDIPRYNFNAWITPDNKFIEVETEGHVGYIKTIYKRFNDPNDAYKKAIADGWVRVTFRNSETNPTHRITTDNELALEGRDKDRIKNVLKTLFYDLVKNGTVQVYIDYPDADNSYSSDIIDPETSDGKSKLVNYINEIKENVAKTYYRAVENNVGKTAVFEPQGFYEAIDDEGNPVIKYDTHWISDKPEVAASHSVGGAVLGLYSMFRQHGKSPNIFYIYGINEEPDVDISHWDMGDFALLQEVRYRRPVKGKYIGKVTITNELKEKLNAYYEMIGGDEYDTPIYDPDYEKQMKIAQNTDYDELIGGVKDLVHETVSVDLPPTLESYNSFMIKDNDQTVGELGIIDRGVFGGNHYITIDKIFINKPFRGKGYANDTMKILFDYADKNNFIITLTPDNVWGASVPKLKAWYSSLGFIMNKGKNKDFQTMQLMYRLPNSGSLNEGAYSGKAYRVDSGFWHERGTTAGDVVRFERDELENIDDFAHITDEKLAELDKYPAKNVVWVTKTYEDAKRYSTEPDFSDIDEFDLTGEILGEDGDGGYLVFMKNTLNESQLMSLDDLPFKKEVEERGGKIYSVGGAVRDGFLGKESKDLDLLIAGIPIEELKNILQKYGSASIFGQSFAVIKYKPTGASEDIDIAVPRTDTPTGGGGHRDFKITADHNLPIEKDLERRDFTINAIAKDASGNIIDPYGGQEDLKNKIIRAVNPEAFSDDPLRMLRAVQFASRFDFTIEPKTMQMIIDSAKMIKKEPADRILTEFGKIVEKGVPRIGAQLLKDTGLYTQIFGTELKQSVIDRSPFEDVKTIGEFIFLLIRLFPDPAEYFLERFATKEATGSRIYKEIQALEMAYHSSEATTMIEARSVAHNMYIKHKESLQSEILPHVIKVAAQELMSGKYPKTVNELAIDGNDIMNLGIPKGKGIGEMQKKLLLKIYSDKLQNDKKELSTFVNDTQLLNENIE